MTKLSDEVSLSQFFWGPPMKVRKEKTATFHGEDGETLRVYPDNMGEPYRSGMTFYFESDYRNIGCFLEEREVESLHKVLSQYLGYLGVAE